MSNTPRRKRMNRIDRLKIAKTWIENYNGKNIVRGYSKWFGVDLLCTIKELEIMGLQIDEKYKREIIQSKEAVIQHKKNHKNEIVILTEELFSFLHKSTGEIIQVSLEDYRAAEDEMDLSSFPEWKQESIEQDIEILKYEYEYEYINLPSKEDINEYEIMESFCYSQEKGVNTYE